MENIFILSWMIHWLNVKLVECKILGVRIIFLKNLKTCFFGFWCCFWEVQWHFPTWVWPVALLKTSGIYSLPCVLTFLELVWAIFHHDSDPFMDSCHWDVWVFLVWKVFLNYLFNRPCSLPYLTFPFRTVIGICTYMIDFPSLYA